MEKVIFNIILSFVFIANSSASITMKDSCGWDREYQKKEFSKNYNKNYVVNKEDKVFISNRYGKVDIKPSNTSTVDISVKITVKAKSESEAKETFDKITILMSKEPKLVKAETVVDNKSWNSWFNNNNNDFQIDYVVSMPIDNNLDIKNKYGNTYVTSMNSIVTVDQKYGDVKMEQMNGPIGLGIAYGDAELEKATDINIVLSYGNLKMGNAKNVNLKTRYSEVNIMNINNLILDAAYDEIEVNSANTIKVDADYTDLKLDRLNLAADIEMTYGDLVIGSLRKDFSNVSIRSSYTDVSINPELNSSYQLDAYGSYADIAHPSGLKTTLDKEKGNTWEMIGYVGNPNSRSIIKARISYGGLNLK
jgi:hypothetical protein